MNPFIDSSESSNSSGDEILNIVVPFASLRNNPQVAAAAAVPAPAAAAVPAPVAAAAPVAKQNTIAINSASGSCDADASVDASFPATDASVDADADAEDLFDNFSDSSEVSGVSDASPNTAKKLVREMYNEQVRVLRIIRSKKLFRKAFKDWPVKYIIQGLKHSIFRHEETREILSTFVYDRENQDNRNKGAEATTTAASDETPESDKKLAAISTAASVEKKDTEDYDGDDVRHLKPADVKVGGEYEIVVEIYLYRLFALIYIQSVSINSGFTDEESDKKPAAATTTASDKELPPARKNVSGHPSYNTSSSSLLAQTPTFSVLGTDYGGVALSREPPLDALWGASSPAVINVESSTHEQLTITAYKEGAQRVSLSPETADMQSDGSSPYLFKGPEGMNIPQLPESFLNTLSDPPKELATYGGVGSNSFLFMDMCVRSWWRYFIEKGHLPDDEIDSKKSLQEKFDAIFGKEFYDRIPRDKRGMITDIPLDLIREISHSGDKQLPPSEYNIPKLLALFRAQKEMVGQPSMLTKQRRKIAGQLKYPFGTLDIPDEWELVSEDSKRGTKLVPKKKRKAKQGEHGERSFIATIGYINGPVAFPVFYLYNHYEKWNAGKLIFASVGNAGTVGDGYHVLEPYYFDKVRKSKPSNPAEAKRLMIRDHAKKMAVNKWPVLLFQIEM